MKETWKDIKGYEGLYKVSDMGNVFGVKYGRNLTKNLNINKDGFRHLSVNLSKNGVLKTYTVKKIVFNAFVGANKRVIKNINGDEKDCRLINLTDEIPTIRKDSIRIIDSLTNKVYLSAGLLAKELNTKSSVLLYRIRNNNEYSRYKILNMKTGAELISEERQDQIEKGFDAGHDFFNNDKGQLGEISSVLASPDVLSGAAIKRAYKGGSRIGNLVVAGAFIAAEIDRLHLIKIIEDTAEAEALKGKKLSKNEHFLISQFANDPLYEMKLYSKEHGIGYHLK